MSKPSKFDPVTFNKSDFIHCYMGYRDGRVSVAESSEILKCSKDSVRKYFNLYAKGEMKEESFVVGKGIEEIGFTGITELR